MNIPTQKLSLATGLVASILMTASVQASPSEETYRTFEECVKSRALFLADHGEVEQKIPKIAFFMCEQQLSDYLHALTAEFGEEAGNKKAFEMWPKLEPIIVKLVQDRRAKRI